MVVVVLAPAPRLASPSNPPLPHLPSSRRDRALFRFLFFGFLLHRALTTYDCLPDELSLWTERSQRPESDVAGSQSRSYELRRHLGSSSAFLDLVSSYGSALLVFEQARKAHHDLEVAVDDGDGEQNCGDARSAAAEPPAGKYSLPVPLPRAPTRSVTTQRSPMTAPPKTAAVGITCNALRSASAHSRPPPAKSNAPS